MMQKRRKEEGGGRKFGQGFGLVPKPRAGIYRRVRQAGGNAPAKTGRREQVVGSSGGSPERRQSAPQLENRSDSTGKGRGRGGGPSFPFLDHAI